MTANEDFGNSWFITGATGLVGSSIAKELRNEDIPVVGLVRPSSSKEMKDHLRSLGITLVEGDLLDSSSYEEHLKGIKGVIHAAALIEPFDQRDLHFRINADGTKYLLDAMEKNNISRLIFISTCGVYGTRSLQPITEDFPTNPKSAYSKSKLLAENHILKRSSISATIVRCPFIIGPNDRRFIPTLVKRLPKKFFPRPFGPEAKNAILHVRDLNNFILLAAARDRTPHVIYNLQSTELSFSEIASAVYRGMGIEPKTIPIPSFIFEIIGSIGNTFQWLIRREKSFKRRMQLMTKNWIFSTERAQSDLGWQPEINADYLIEKIERLTRSYVERTNYLQN
ncbi:MAG: NAD-dependent epimerase/dehydratase family protein [Methanobacteriota archaeon]|nr:MAG: NAD-dependent epimerase/dehydratase family protein [Euryarchaeota archaeon]